MTDNYEREMTVSDLELTTMRHNVNLLRSQIQAGRVDTTFLLRQVEKLGDLLERIEVAQRARLKSSRFEALYNVSRLLGSSLDLDTVLDQVLDAILMLTGAERGFLMLRDDDGQLSVKSARNLDQQTLGSDKFHYSRTVVNQVMDGGQPIVTTNASEDPRFSGQASIVAQALRSIMATPLRARGRTVGVVYVDNRAIAGLFDEDDLAALDTFAGQAAIAIENARLFSATDQQLQERIEALTQLRRVDMQLNESLDSDKAMLYTLEWAARLSGADEGYLGLIADDGSWVRLVHKVGAAPSDAADEAMERLDVAFPEALGVATSGKTTIVSRRELNRRILIVPVHREQAVIGVVVLTREGHFNDNQVDLVERVVTRAATAIENARLYAAVQAADIAKSEFVGIVAHDLKVPMTNVLGYADLMLTDEGLDARQIDFLSSIRDNVRRMEMLVSDLADISRIESGQFYMEVSRVSIRDIVQAVRDSTFMQIAARNHTFVEQVEPDLPPMDIDYYRLLQVLTNLVSNAYKYTPPGGTITLSARQSGDCIEWRVADTGIGLSPEKIKKLGTKFWRSDDAFTRSQPGTGLGFAITRSLIEQMGSSIQIESAVGRGSTFTFCVPIARREVDQGRGPG